MNAPKGKYAWTATVGEKGQIVIPKQARDIFGIKPGDTLLLLGDEQRGIAIPPKGAFTELFGIAYGEKDGDSDRKKWLSSAFPRTVIQILCFPLRQSWFGVGTQSDFIRLTNLKAK